MQYFKNSLDDIFAFDNDVTLEQINSMQPGLTVITETQANELTQPSDAEILVEARAVRIAYMTLQCSNEIKGGISSNALGTIHNYDSRAVDQLNWDGALSMATANTNPASGQPGHDADLPEASKGWITCNDPGGSLGYLKRGHTVAQVHKVRADFLLMKYTKSEKLQTKITAINASSDPLKIEW